MPASLRNQLKSRVQRLGEVLTHSHLKSGQADSQVILQGCDLGFSTVSFTIAVGEVVLAGAVVALAATGATAVPAGAATAAGQFRKVLIEKDSANAVSTVVGNIAADQASAVLPAGDPTKISVGYIEVPASFTPGTTSLTAPMLKKVAYHA